MTQPINLSKARKARAKAKKTAQASENARKFGRTKAEREAEEADRTRATNAIEAHKVQKTPEN
ncbi:MAG: DUF4169 family protein [Pseudomonadota bacterium]